MCAFNVPSVMFSALLLDIKPEPTHPEMHCPFFGVCHTVISPLMPFSLEPLLEWWAKALGLPV